MFERFTREARAAVVGAQEEARSRAAQQIDTTHLLVALLRSGGEAARAVSAAGGDVAALTQVPEHGDLDADALSALGVDLAEVSAKADKLFGPDALGRAARSPKNLPFTREAKKSLQLALREAVRLQERTIGDRHLLLGMIRAECPARTALAAHGTDLTALRSTLETPQPRSA